MRKQWFDTLEEALASEHLLEVWPAGKQLAAGEKFEFVGPDRCHVSVRRDYDGKYERPFVAVLGSGRDHKQSKKLINSRR